jgi:hypothetical protein
LNSGKVKSIEQVHDVAIVYDYSELKVGMNMSESLFLTRMSEDLNKKKPGEGDRIKSEWNSYKTNYYEPVFEKTFNEKTTELKQNLQGKNYAEDKNFTLKVNVFSIVTGPVQKTRERAYVSLECSFLDHEGTELCRFYMKDIAADADKYGPAVNERVAFCFYKAAELFVEKLAAERRRAR